MSMPTKEEQRKAVIKKIAAEQDTDIILYNGPIHRPTDTQIIRQCIERRKRPNVMLMMVTTGGDPDAAYRIARCLQDKYEKFVFYVPGYCKSAGTIVALGAHELIVSDFGELGPLDVQMSKKDELFELQSGLTVMDAITTLNEKSYAAFEQFFLSTKAGGSGSITMHTAAEIATQLTTGLFSKLYGQIDPMHVGEAGRAMKIANYYGVRLLDKGRNIDQGALNFINAQYPHHGFVIDRAEAELLFANVREPSPDEFFMADLLVHESRVPHHAMKLEVCFLNEELPNVGEDDAGEDGKVEGQQLPGDCPESGERAEEGAEEQSSGNVAQIHEQGS